MTEENYNYRTSPFLLRNQFKGTGKFNIPIIPKFEAKDDDFNDLKLIGFDKTKLENNNHLDRMVHFFLYDYKFERVWKNPDTDLEKLRRYKAVLTPDFSMYTEMNPTLQLYNTFRNRWCGAYYAAKGIRVIPTVSWGDENTFEFCFDGITKGSTVAVSTYMVTEHYHHKEQKEFFLKGYNEMLKSIEPEKIICYNKPFPEMQGDIVFVDYDLSSWRYMNDDPYVPSKYAKYICGLEPLPKNSNIVIKTGYIPTRDITVKGMGSAYGGEWQPAKEDDERFLGEPGEIIDSRAEGKKGGYERKTKIGEDGKATKERHYTDHDNPNQHSNPHDHNINWNSPKPGIPNFEKPHINYPDGNIPEFKSYRRQKSMAKIIKASSFEDRRFKAISDFKDCMIRGGEVEFEFNERVFGIFPKLQRTSNPEQQMLICEKFVDNQEDTEKWCDNADEVLEYIIDGVRLRDVITEVKIWDRTI